MGHYSDMYESERRAHAFERSRWMQEDRQKILDALDIIKGVLSPHSALMQNYKFAEKLRDDLAVNEALLRAEPM